MKSLLYHGFGIKGYRYRRTRYEKGEIIFELEPEGRPEVPPRPMDVRLRCDDLRLPRSLLDQFEQARHARRVGRW